MAVAHESECVFSTMSLRFVLFPNCSMRRYSKKTYVICALNIVLGSPLFVIISIFCVRSNTEENSAMYF